MQRGTSSRPNPVLGVCLPLFGLLSAACGATDDGGDASDTAATSADTYALTSNRRLLHFERSTGAIASTTPVTAMMPEDSLIGLDFRPANGMLYVVSRSGKLYSMNPARGALVVMTSLIADAADASSPFDGLEGNVFGVNFNPVADRLRIVSDTGQNLRINVETGATTTDAPLNPGTPSAAAASYSSSFAAACRTQLFVIDNSTNTLFLQDPPNDGTLRRIGAVPGPDAESQSVGFEIATGEDGRVSAFTFWPDAKGAALYDIDIRSGELSNGRALRLEPGETLVGMSAPTPAESPRQALGELLGVSTENELVSFNRNAPGKPCTDDPITGIGDDEEVLGIDVRPADGALYAIGSAGTIYTVDTATGAATLHSTLAADPNDTSQPFTRLPEGDYGLAFNPVPDRLRVISSDGTNLRVNVDTGATTTDSSLSPSSMAVPAVAYTNGYAGATTTALYAIDVGSGALMLVGGNPATGGACPDDANNPNCGNATEVGSLGLPGMSVGGFDIDGDPATTAGWLALGVQGEDTSMLFMVDLATGAVSPPPGVQNPIIGGGAALRALSFARNPVAP